jgi:hypothetical protein
MWVTRDATHAGGAGATGVASESARLIAAEAGGKAADENFPVALRFLPARYRHHLAAVYGFARSVDDMGDEAPLGERLALLSELEADVRRLYRHRGDRGAGHGDGGPGSSDGAPRNRLATGNTPDGTGNSLDGTGISPDGALATPGASVAEPPAGDGGPSGASAMPGGTGGSPADGRAPAASGGNTPEGRAAAVSGASPARLGGPADADGGPRRSRSAGSRLSPSST